MTALETILYLSIAAIWKEEWCDNKIVHGWVKLNSMDWIGR